MDSCGWRYQEKRMKNEVAVNQVSFDLTNIVQEVSE